VDVDAKHSSLNIDVTQLPLKDLTSRSKVRFSIQDTGIGIAPEHIERLFEPFVQVDSALNRHYSGTGLGLALVKNIVELHGGTVGLTSEVGVGSCFTFDLPCEKYDGRTTASLIHKDMPETEHDQPLVQQHNSPLILLAEDNEANILTISALPV
jgi:K+-sensing histidine kinase KdpD